VFGEELAKLLEKSGMKQYLLAQALQYDASYVSKWISGASLPSEKTAVEVTARIGAFIAENATDAAVETICREWDIHGREELAQAASAALLEAYGDSVGTRKPVRQSGDVSFVVNPTGERVLCTASRKRLNVEKTLRIAVFADLLGMSRTAKLELAGIENGRFAVYRKLKNVRLDMVIPPLCDDESGVYNTILIIHMLTNYSRLCFSLYSGTYVCGKIACAVDRQYVFTTILGDGGRCLTNTLCNNAGAAEQAYVTMASMINQENLLFRKTDMNRLLLEQYYAQSVLSPNVRWLLGHMMELLLPEDVFGEMMRTLTIDAPLRESMERAYFLTKNVLAFSTVRVMIYESAITNYALTGEMDFFNRKLTATVDQRLRHLTLLMDTLGKQDNVKLQLIRRGFSDDFQHITNPCVFLSDTTGYLRLENGEYEDDILLINGVQNRGHFDRFFEEIWHGSADVSYSDKATVSAFIRSQIDALNMLNLLENEPGRAGN